MRSQPIRAVALGALLLSLAACAGTAVDSTAASTPAQGPPPPAPLPPVAALPPPDAPVGPPTDAQRLVGVKGDVLRTWIGETVFVRRDGQAEIWRFAADNCYLDVFLYREADGLRVAHVDARSRSGPQRIAPQACYSRILAARPARGSS